MTEPIGTPTPDGEIAESGLDDSAIDESADDAMIDARTAKRLRNEAQSLRHRLRESEEGRAGDLARLAAYERQAVEQVAGTVLIDPQDLWAHTDAATQAQWNDEFGSITADRVVEAAKKLAAERPHLAKPNTTPPPSQRTIEGLRPGASPARSETPVATWSQALRGR